jgi:DNA-binding MarR family transcriptional regulator
MRLCRQELINEVLREQADSGMGDLRAAHAAVTQQLAAQPDGLRLTELASYAGMTKASMSALVDALEERGYVERVPDPRDQRASLVRFTARGWQAARAARRAIARVERGWARRVGERDLVALRRILRTLVDSRPAGSRG